MRSKTMITAIVLSALAITTVQARAESSAEALEEQNLKELALDQALAIDQLPSELMNQGITLSPEGAEALQSYSELLKSEAQKPKMNPKIKKLFKTIGKGLEKAGLGVLKTTAYIGVSGARILVLPILTMSSFTEGLVTGSDPSETLETAGIITGVVATAFMSVPLYFSFPILIPMTPAFGITGYAPANLLCNSDRYADDEKMDRFCTNIESIEEALSDIPQDATFSAGATIHDSVQKVIRKIFRKRSSR